MAGKKKTKKKGSPEKTALSLNEENIISDIIKNPEIITPENIKDNITSGEMALAMAERINIKDNRSVNLLFMIEDSFEEKKIVKAVKKALFKLKQKGIEIPPRGDRTPVLFTQATQDEGSPQAYIGAMDLEGERSVLLMIPRGNRGIEINLAVISHKTGMQYSIQDHYGKKRALELKKYFFEENFKVIETSLAHAGTILENSYKKNKLIQSESISNYLKLRPWLLDNITLLEEPVIYDFISREEIFASDISASDIKKLFEHELAEFWIMDDDELAPVMEDLLKVDESVILVSEQQKIGRVETIMEKALPMLFTPEKRLLLREILEEIAYILYKLDEKEYAGICLAAALEAGDSSPTGRDLFLRHLLERSINFFMENSGDEDQDMSETDSIPEIITP